MTLQESFGKGGQRTLHSAPAWRREFLHIVAELADLVGHKTLQQESSPSDGPGWTTHEMLQPLHEDSERSIEANGTLLDIVEDRGMLSGVTPDELFILLLGRGLSSVEPAAATDYPLRSVLFDILRSAEFSLSLPWLVKSTMGRGRWNYFVHVPKTAGSYVQAMLWTHYGPGSVFRTYQFQDLGVCDPWVTSMWVRHVIYSDEPEVWISGHVPLAEMRPQHSLWPTDRVATLIRDPLDQAVSAANYFLGVHRRRPDEAQRYFAQVLGEDCAPSALGASELLRRILQRDTGLRLSYYFDNQVIPTLLSPGSVCGFQDDANAFLRELVHPNVLRIPEAAASGDFRMNSSVQDLRLEDLAPSELAEVVACQPAAIAEYHLLRRVLPQP
jgi:hypothetical protein